MAEPKTKLSRSVFKALRQDDPALLLKLLNGQAPERFHELSLLDAPLFLKCFQAGAEQCALALLAAAPAPGRLWILEDGIGRTAALLATEAASESTASLAASQAPEAASILGPNAEPPLEVALKRGFWAAAASWLEADPAQARKLDSYGRTALHCAAEPGFFHLGIEAAYDGRWTPPPTPLLEALVAAGADPLALNRGGMSALDCALIARAEAASLYLIDQIAERGGDFNILDIPSDKMRSQVASIHLAAKHDMASAIRDLSARGASLDELSERNLSPLRVAVLNAAFESMKTLVELGADLSEAGTESEAEAIPSTTRRPKFSLANAALRSPKPLECHRLIAALGADPWEADTQDDHVTPLELAFERLPFDHAVEFWTAADPTLRVSHHRANFSVFDRAARSELDSEAKMRWLWGRGCRPERYPDSDASWARPERIGVSSSYGYITRPNCFIVSDGDASLPFDKRITFTRPCLPAYLASSGRTQSFLALARIDEELGPWFGASDWACAWREGLEADASMEVLSVLRARVRAFGVDANAFGAREAALRRLGPRKLAALGFSWINAGASVEAMLDGSPNRLFLRSGWNNEYRHGSSSPLGEIWTLALANGSNHAVDALLVPGMPFPGAGAFATLAAVAGSHSPKMPAIFARLVAKLPALAAAAPIGSPWRDDPENFWSRLGDQLDWEWNQAALANKLSLSTHGTPRSPDKPGDKDGPLTALLLLLADTRWGLLEALPNLIGKVPLPKAPRRVAEAVFLKVGSWLQHRRAPPEVRHGVRSAFHRFLADPEWGPVFHAPELLHRVDNLGDPVLFDTYIQSLPERAELPFSAFQSLASSWSGQISPAFAGRIAAAASASSGRDARFDEQTARLEIAKRLSGCTRMEGVLDNSPTMTARVLAACKGVGAAAWLAPSPDPSVFEAALKHGNVACAMALWDSVPDVVSDAFSKVAFPFWLIGRAAELRRLEGQRLNVFDDASNFDDVDPDDCHPDYVSKAKTLRQEFLVLRRRGSFGSDPEADSRAVREMVDAGALRSIDWAIRAGLDPKALVDVSFIPFDGDEPVDARAPAICGLISSSCSSSSDPASVADCVIRWMDAGFPMNILWLSSGSIESRADDDEFEFDFFSSRPRGSRVRVAEGEASNIVDFLAPKSKSVLEESLFQREMAPARPLARKPSL